jgi:hypothetical protein
MERLSDFDKRFKELLRVASVEDLQVMLAVLLFKQDEHNNPKSSDREIGKGSQVYNSHPDGLYGVAVLVIH